MGEHPAHPNVGGVASWKYSQTLHTWGVLLFGKKFWEKNLEHTSFCLYIWWVGGFVCIRTDVVFIGLKKVHNIA
jgi:hypothetical protein